jgi:hypothetical protein
MGKGSLTPRSGAAPSADQPDDSSRLGWASAVMLRSAWCESPPRDVPSSGTTTGRASVQVEVRERPPPHCVRRGVSRPVDPVGRVGAQRPGCRDGKVGRSPAGNKARRPWSLILRRAGRAGHPYGPRRQLESSIGRPRGRELQPLSRGARCPVRSVRAPSREVGSRPVV